MRSPPRHTSVGLGRKHPTLQQATPVGWAMAVHTRPRNDGVLVNESTGETRDNAGRTEQRGLKGKLGSLRAAAVAPDAWSAPQRGSSKLGLFGMLGRLGLALSAAAVVGFL